MPEWTYDYSPTLKMKFAVRVRNGLKEAYTEDKVYYNDYEITALKKTGELPLEVHLVKKLFNGIILFTAKERL